MFHSGVQIPVSISLLFGIECLDCCFGPFYPGGEVYCSIPLQWSHLETSLLPRQLVSIQHDVVLAQG